MDKYLCGHCRHIKRCQDLIQRRLIDRPCDWEPSRFVYSPEVFGEGVAGDTMRFEMAPEPPKQEID